MTANLSKRVTKTGEPAAGSTIPAGVITEVQLDEKIVDPNDPRAVQVPEEGLGGGNPLDVHAQPTPNEVFGGGSNYVNPHTGEIVSGPDADATEVSPTPTNVTPAESVSDVQTADDLATTVETEEEAKADAEAKPDAEVPVPDAEPVEEPPADEQPPADESPSPV